MVFLFVCLQNTSTDLDEFSDNINKWPKDKHSIFKNFIIVSHKLIMSS